MKKTTDSLYNELTTNHLIKYGFTHVGKCTFEGFAKMNYWVKDGICLFYDVEAPTINQKTFYIGYAEMRGGQYVAVGFKWIKTTEELFEIYESIVGMKINAETITLDKVTVTHLIEERRDWYLDNEYISGKVIPPFIQLKLDTDLRRDKQVLDWLASR